MQLDKTSLRKPWTLFKQQPPFSKAYPCGFTIHKLVPQPTDVHNRQQLELIFKLLVSQSQNPSLLLNTFTTFLPNVCLQNCFEKI